MKNKIKINGKSIYAVGQWLSSEAMTLSLENEQGEWIRFNKIYGNNKVDIEIEINKA